MKYLLLPVFLFTLAACGESSTTSGNEKDKGSTADVQSKPAAPVNTELKNGITVEEKGLKVAKAMLLKTDGTAIGDDNTVGIGEEILCRLFVSGWKEVDGKVQLGAGQTIETEEGNVVLEEPDLFKNIGSASAEDAGVITLKATITELKKSIKTFVVSFRIWDKVSNDEVNGEYTFHLK